MPFLKNSNTNSNYSYIQSFANLTWEEKHDDLFESCWWICSERLPQKNSSFLNISNFSAIQEEIEKMFTVLLNLIHNTKYAQTTVYLL